MKKNFFGQYFIYKFSNLRGFFVASIVLALAGVPTLVTILKIIISISLAEIKGENTIFSVNDIGMVFAIYCANLLILLLIGSFAMAAITPIFAFNFYNNRALTDTIGSLPLTYNQRFFGDFLAGFTVSVAPYLVCLPYILITLSGLIPQDEELEELYMFFDEFKMISVFLTRYSLRFAIILVAAFMFSSMIASCCGKTGSTVMYSLLGMAFVPGVVLVYSGIAVWNAVGVENFSSMLEAMSFIPPGGLIPDFLNFWNILGGSSFSEFNILTNISPASYAVMLVLTAAFGAGAYFLGKYRKAERTDRDFVYEGAYAVMSTIFSACIMGAGIFMYLYTQESVVYIIVGVVAAAIVAVALEYSHTKSYRTLMRTFIKFAVVSAVCFGIFGLSKLTDSFGLADVIPSVGEISRIEINGEYFYSYDGNGIVYDEHSAIETIVSEHKKLISDKSKITTGNDIKISYKLKNGFVINRQYACAEKESTLIKELANTIKDLPTRDSNVYGVLSSEDYSDLSFSGFYDVPYTTEEGYEYYNTVRFTIKSSKTEEFKKILLNDIKNHYSEHDHAYGYTYKGHITAFYTRDGVRHEEYFSLFEPYEESIAFIKNPNNCTTSINDNNSEPEAESTVYTAELRLGEEYLEFEFYSDNVLGKELIKLCSKENEGELSDIVSITDKRGTRYRFGKADEAQAIKLIFELAKEYFG